LLKGLILDSGGTKRGKRVLVVGKREESNL